MGLFDLQVSRKPDLYPWAQTFKKAMQNGFWTEAEFNFTSDIQNFKVDLSEEERGVIIRALSAISQVEQSVKQWWGRLGENLPNPSMIDLGYVMAATEVVHNDAYDKLLNVLGISFAIEENLQTPILAGRVKYLGKRNIKFSKDAKRHFIHSLILFTLLVENVSLFSQFYIVLWFGRYKNVLKDTNQQVAYTKNEETIHGQVGAKIISVLREEYPELFDEELKDSILKEVQDAFIHESKLIDWILGGFSSERINSEIVKEYTKERFNESLIAMGYAPVFSIDKNLERDFEWMTEEVVGTNSTDFFYKRPVDYVKNNRAFENEELF